MKQMYEILMICCSAVVGVVSYMYGQFDGFIACLIAFICVDYLTGVMCAVKDHKLSSNVGFVGICRKVLILLMVGIGGLLDRLIQTGDSFRNMMAFFYIANEGLSIVENCERMGLPVPKKLLAILHEIKEKGDDDNAEETKN